MGTGDGDVGNSAVMVKSQLNGVTRVNVEKQEQGVLVAGMQQSVDSQSLLGRWIADDI